MTTAAIGIGGNLGDAARNVREAMRLLGELGRLTAVSRLYRTKPWGIINQPDFYNAAVLIEVTLSAWDLLSAVKTIEKRLGRAPTYRWGPRVIDIDILTFGDQCLDDDGLKLPHPEMMKRAFVLAPLSEIDASYSEAFAALPEEEKEQVQVDESAA